MGKPYSMDLRERVVAAIEGGESTHQAAARFAIGIATAGAWARLKRSTGDVRPAKQGKPKGAVLDAHADFILYPVHVTTRKSLGLMMRKLSVTESQRSAQFRGTFSRRKPSVASANWVQVA